VKTQKYKKIAFTQPGNKRNVSHSSSILSSLDSSNTENQTAGVSIPRQETKPQLLEGPRKESSLDIDNRRVIE
jgi:hypothetical protein